MLDEELAHGRTACAVCRLRRNLHKAKQRRTETPLSEIEARYRALIRDAQAVRVAAGLPRGGRTSRDRMHRGRGTRHGNSRR